jgi:hypothetical protein
MKIRNNNPLDLEGQNGEQITVSVEATGTVFAVTRDLNGSTAVFSQPFSFPLDKDPTILVLFFVFSGPSGGVYKTTVTGKPGSDTSHFTVGQFAGEASNAIAFTFDLV